MYLRDTLSSATIAPADAEILLGHVLGRPRTWVLAHGDYELSEAELAVWKDAERRRAAGEPVSHITGEKEFYGRTFKVTPHVLTPRPATESLVSLALELLKDLKESVVPLDADIVGVAVPLRDMQPQIVVDIGTGSGCIAVTLACERPDLGIIATDISDAALTVAKQNAGLHAAGRIEFRKGSGLTPLQDLTQPFLIVSNPPYIPAGTQLVRDVADFEPHAALFSGEDGADVIREIAKEAASHPFCTGMVIECMQQHVVILQGARPI